VLANNLEDVLVIHLPQTHATPLRKLKTFLKQPQETLWQITRQSNSGCERE